MGSQSVQALVSKLNFFEQIEDQVYLRLVNAKERELVISQHSVNIRKFTKFPTIEKQIMGVLEGEGLPFLGDTSQSTAYHFKLDSGIIPEDLNQIKITETKMRDPMTFGCT